MSHCGRRKEACELLRRIHVQDCASTIGIHPLVVGRTPRAVEGCARLPTPYGSDVGPAIVAEKNFAGGAASSGRITHVARNMSLLEKCQFLHGVNECGVHAKVQFLG